MHLAAAKVKNHRALFTSGLYWAATNDEDEADYLCAIMNSAITTVFLRPYMSYGKDERDIHKHVWQLSIQIYDKKYSTHARLVELGRQAEAIAAAFHVDFRFAFRGNTTAYPRNIGSVSRQRKLPKW